MKMSHEQEKQKLSWFTFKVSKCEFLFLLLIIFKNSPETMKMSQGLQNKYEHYNTQQNWSPCRVLKISLNPFPAKAFVPLVKTASKNSRREVLLARSLHFQNITPVWSAWKVGIEARGHITSYRHAGPTLRRTSSDVIMAVNGLNSMWENATI